jgi:hypothetical protein
MKPLDLALLRHAAVFHGDVAQVSMCDAAPLDADAFGECKRLCDWPDEVWSSALQGTYSLLCAAYGARCAAERASAEAWEEEHPTRYTSASAGPRDPMPEGENDGVRESVETALWDLIPDATQDRINALVDLTMSF